MSYKTKKNQASQPNIAPHAPSNTAPLFAALDLGTNNCRLLIASGDQAGVQAKQPLHVVDSFSRIVRLGESITKTGKLSDDAMDRTIAALSICKKKMAKYRLEDCRLVATEACRKASNTLEFIKRVEKEVGLTIEVINNQEEASLAVIGCSSLLNPTADKAIVFDIGGGSTEVIWLDVQRLQQKQAQSLKSFLNLEDVVIDWVSIDSGVMNLADRFGGTGFIDVTYHDMVQFLRDKLEVFNQKNKISDVVEQGAVQMLSTSGTLTTLAAIEMGLPKYDRAQVDGTSMEISRLRQTVKNIRAMRPSERFHNGCIGPERADFILSGCAVFDAVSSLWPTQQVTIADRGVREGIIISQMLHHE